MPTKNSNTVDYKELVSGDEIASLVANMWQGWKSSRAGWEAERAELRNYLFATDTSTTTNGNLPWKNTTTRPKLTQIRDNLHANYMAALFPHEDWFTWEAANSDAANKEKAKIIEAYMKNKIKQSGFMQTMSQLVYDYIDYGNAFAEVTYVRETAIDPEGSGLELPKYSGPKLVRISPLNIVMNPKAQDFHSTPHIVRSLMSAGELAKMRKTVAGAAGWIDEAFDKAFSFRQNVSANAGQYEDPLIQAALNIDGFGNLYEYYSSGQVEVLEFHGDLYDSENDELLENYRIIVVDRAHVVFKGPYDSWLGQSNREHVGWRQRPDNLWAMGPLDNLVGMQYRIDHLENLKADVFDQIALPLLKIRGDVEDFDYQPGGRIYMGEEGDVAPMVPDATALNADFQIQALENKMEEFAGAPRQAMGIRTPGEKTAFEVQTLQNAASRIFQHKASKFEREFIEPVLNAMLEAARRNMDYVDVVRVLDDETGALLFQNVTKEDITARGRITPVGARHFAERAQRLQNLNSLIQIKQDPTVGAHISGKKIAELISYELGEEALYGENIAVQEQMETQQSAQDKEADMMERMQVAAEEGL